MALLYEYSKPIKSTLIAMVIKSVTVFMAPELNIWVNLYFIGYTSLKIFLFVRENLKFWNDLNGTGRRQFIIPDLDQPVLQRMKKATNMTIATEMKDGNHQLSNTTLRQISHQLETVMQHIQSANNDGSKIGTVMSQFQWYPFLISGRIKRAAFVFSGPAVFVESAIMKHLNEDELFLLLAHEMSHVCLRHSAEKASVSYILEYMLDFIPPLIALVSISYASIFSIIVAFAVNCMSIATLAFACIFMPPWLSRIHELEADFQGMRLLEKTGKNLQNALGLFDFVDLFIPKKLTLFGLFDSHPHPIHTRKRRSLIQLYSSTTTYTPSKLST